MDFDPGGKGCIIDGSDTFQQVMAVFGEWRQGSKGSAWAVTAETELWEHAGGTSGRNGGRCRPNVEGKVGVGGVALFSYMPLSEGETLMEGGMEGGPTRGLRGPSWRRVFMRISPKTLISWVNIIDTDTSYKVVWAFVGVDRVACVQTYLS